MTTSSTDSRISATNEASENMWAVILCGGRGSRMGDITDSLPKPLIEVHGKPILWFSFWTLYEKGVRNFIFPLGYKGNMIRDYILSISQGLEVNIITVDTGISATIASRINDIKTYIPDQKDFFLINSDTIFDFDIVEMLKHHRTSDALVTLSSVEVVSTWGLINVVNDKIVGFDRERKVRYLISDEESNQKGLVNSGLAWINKSALFEIDLLKCGGSFEESLYTHLIKIGRAAHYQIKGQWFPIDTPKDLSIMNWEVSDKHQSGLVTKAIRDKIETTSLNQQ